MKQRMKKEFFEGRYYKHQKDENMIAFIPGRCSQGEFLQVITNHKAYQLWGRQNCSFSPTGMQVGIENRELTIFGDLQYYALTPIKYDIMGPFRFLPMECRHEVVSMHHKLAGRLMVNGRIMEFTDGVGYIEGDRGASFPNSYFWIQCNAFPEKTAIMASVADIPMGRGSFKGCICVVYHQGTEYRLATYRGVKIQTCTKDQLVLTQGNYLLQVEVTCVPGHKLQAPSRGRMTRSIHESPACSARFRFYDRGSLLFDLCSCQASFEFV